MAYYQALGLKKEPFSTSPDPAFFYRSGAHVSALERLEISLRMKRGLCLVMGDVGTGKTTLGRVLMRNMGEEKDVDFHLILNPLFQSEFQFLEHLCKIFRAPMGGRSTMDCLESLEGVLYQRGVTEGRTTVLVIDEGQNLTGGLIELLRSLLNFETNEYKLLQLVILGQLEALPRFQRIRNFMDRVSMKYVINPFDEEETRRMIVHRLQQAGAGPKGPMFTDDALRRVYQLTQGYPRRINRLCQKALEALASADKRVADAALIDGLAGDMPSPVEEEA